jgi:glutamate N-acetyltransferase / amino-acid N-acetyltransferase
MKVLESGLDVPGYKFAAIECGIKKQGRLDFCAITADKPCNAAAMFTTNKIFAAPVRLSRERVNNPVRAILINATNANACTGDEGYRNTVILTGEFAKLIGADSNSVLMASTGIIGHQLPVEKMKNSLPQIASSLSRDNASLIPKAIMTTDTFAKSFAVEFAVSAGTFRIAGTAKGSGMIAPNMATLLSFIITDCPVAKSDLERMFRRCVSMTMNSITIDGDMSTNDTAILLSPVSEKYISGNDLDKFEDALERVLFELSRMLVMDGEGATKFVTVKVVGALNTDEAVLIARAVSESMLVKTAFFGKDPNWGRIACAAGYSGASVKEESLSIFIDDIQLLDNGVPCGFDAKAINEVLSHREFGVLIDAGLGKGEARFLTSDISYEYVKINAEYST